MEMEFFKAQIKSIIDSREEYRIKAGFQYIRKIPTGNPKRPFIYIYKDDSPEERRTKILEARKLRNEKRKKPGILRTPVNAGKKQSISAKVVETISNFFGFKKKEDAVKQIDTDYKESGLKVDKKTFEEIYADYFVNKDKYDAQFNKAKEPKEKKEKKEDVKEAKEKKESIKKVPNIKNKVLKYLFGKYGNKQKAERTTSPVEQTKDENNFDTINKKKINLENKQKRKDDKTPEGTKREIEKKIQDTKRKIQDNIIAGRSLQNEDLQAELERLQQKLKDAPEGDKEPEIPPNTKMIIEEGFRLISGSIPLQVRKELNQSVKYGLLKNAKKDGLLPEVYYAPEKEKEALDARRKRANEGIDAISKVFVKPEEKPKPVIKPTTTEQRDDVKEKVKEAMKEEEKPKPVIKPTTTEQRDDVKEKVKEAMKEEAANKPELKGSEKQIDWAEKIRDKAFSNFKGIKKPIIPPKTEKGKLFYEIISKRLEIINNIENATFWIDFRTASVDELIQFLKPHDAMRGYKSVKEMPQKLRSKAIELEALIDKAKSLK